MSRSTSAPAALMLSIREYIRSSIPTFCFPTKFFARWTEVKYAIRNDEEPGIDSQASALRRADRPASSLQFVEPLFFGKTMAHALRVNIWKQLAAPTSERGGFFTDSRSLYSSMLLPCMLKGDESALFPWNDASRSNFSGSSLVLKNDARGLSAPQFMRLFTCSRKADYASLTRQAARLRIHDQDILRFLLNKLTSQLTRVHPFRGDLCAGFHCVNDIPKKGLTNKLKNRFLVFPIFKRLCYDPESCFYRYLLLFSLFFFSSGFPKVVRSESIHEQAHLDEFGRKLKLDRLHAGNVEVVTGQLNANSPMEDKYVNAKFYILGDSSVLAAVFDGHGGPNVAEYGAHNLLRHVEREIPQNFILSSSDNVPLEVDYEKAFTNSYLNLDHELERLAEMDLLSNLHSSRKIGSCCLSLLVTDTKLVVANIGDCKAVLSRAGYAIPLNNEHTANLPLEQMRLEAKHPNEKVVVCKNSWYEYPNNSALPSATLEASKNQRNFIKTEENVETPSSTETNAIRRFSGCYVKQRLQPTRSFGDFFLKNEVYSVDPKTSRSLVPKPHSFPYISATPEVNVVSRQPSDEFIILASDGVWDYLSDQKAIDLVRNDAIHTSVEAAVLRILSEVHKLAMEKSGLPLSEFESLEPKSRRKFVDDLTVSVVKLKAGKPYSSKNSVHISFS